MADPALAQAFASQGLDWIVPAWTAPPRVHAFATTRNGGASRGSAASLDVGGAHFGRDAGDAAAIAENRRRIAAFLPGPPVWLEQVHGRSVVVVDAANVDAMRAAPRCADALVTRAHDIALAIRIADCVPVLLAARDVDAIGAAHAGWRGLAAGVLEATVAAMNAPPSSVVAWLGPAIGPAAFEVGAEVVAAFCDADKGARGHFRAGSKGKWLADLHALARRRLNHAGVVDVHTDDSCTYSDAARFFSFRRDGVTGRMVSLIWQTRD